MNRATPLLQLQNVSLNHGQRQVLHQINLDLHPGEILTLIGPNGAGKTSLVKVALGLLKPSAGRVAMQTGLRVGYMPQRLQIEPSFPLTVRRFLALADRCDRDQIAARLAEVGALQVIDAPLQNLSGGETQRVLLARALMRDPQLLVLDEPVQGVDVHGQMELYELIGGLRNRHACAVLMVSHDLHLVMAATDRVLCLNRHICCSGTPEAVTSDPAYLELFGPQAVRHLAIYSHDSNHRHDDCRDCKEANDAR